MPIQCLTAGRMTMSATVLHQNDVSGYPSPVQGDLNLGDYGDWVDSQDPLTGEIVRKWEPTPVTYDPYNPAPATPVSVYHKIPCIARGIVDGGIRVAGTTERFGDSYENIDYVKLWVPASVRISKRDRVTNISDPRGHVMWLDEEFVDPHTAEVPRATVFDVNGVTPLFNAYNRMTEQFVLLQRSSVRGDQ